MSKKRTRKQIMKAFNDTMKDAQGQQDVNVGKGLKQKVRIIDKVPLEQDEFTEHKELKNILADFVVKARDAQDHYRTRIKQMVQEVASRLEDKLIEKGKPELICHISGELIHILKQHHIRWEAIYIRRCLPEKYKDPAYRAYALARREQQKKGNAGVPINSGRTIEELEAQLNGKQTGEFIVVGTNLTFTKSFDASTIPHKKMVKAVNQWIVKEVLGKLLSNSADEENKVLNTTISIPVIVKVNVKDRSAVVELDNDAFDKLPSDINAAANTNKDKDKADNKPSPEQNAEAGEAVIEKLKEWYNQ